MADDTSSGSSSNPFASLANALMIPNTPNFINPAYSTPAQRAELYKYADALMNSKQPVKNWAQGLGELSRALVGGYEGHQADVASQAAADRLRSDTGNTIGRLDSPNGTVPPPSSPPVQGSSAPDTGLPANASSYVEAGTDMPSTAARFYADNGVTNPLGAAALAGNTQYESGFKPYAVNRGDGRDGSDSVNLGQWNGVRAQAFNKFAADNNLNPNDPKTGLAFQAQELHSTEAPAMAALNAARTPEEANAAALSYYRPAGYTAKDPTHSAGYNDRLGYTKQIAAALLGQNGLPAGARAYAGSAPAIPAAHQALADALLNRAPPTQTAQNGMPVSPGQIGNLLANPNLSPEQFRAFNEQLQPKQFTTATGQVVNSYQNHPVGAPIAELGVLGNGDNPVTLTTGGVNNPSTRLLTPQGYGRPPQQGAPAAMAGSGGVGPGSDFAHYKQDRALTDASVDAIKAKATASQQRFQKTQEEGPMLIAASYPLRQIQGLFEKNGGVMPSGEGADAVMGKESLANMIGTLLGHPLTTEDSSLTAMQLLKKYGVQVAGAQAQQLNVHPTNLGLETAEHTSPGTSLSGPANMHLVDNLVRLNDLSQRKNKFEHDFYLNHGQSADSYDTFTQEWQKEISGAKAVPLSKYPVATKDYKGQHYDKLPSTDPTGFSWFPAGSVK